MLDTCFLVGLDSLDGWRFKTCSRHVQDISRPSKHQKSMINCGILAKFINKRLIPWSVYLLSSYHRSWAPGYFFSRLPCYWRRPPLRWTPSITQGPSRVGRRSSSAAMRMTIIWRVWGRNGAKDGWGGMGMGSWCWGVGRAFQTEKCREMLRNVENHELSWHAQCRFPCSTIDVSEVFPTPKLDESPIHGWLVYIMLLVVYPLYYPHYISFIHHLKQYRQYPLYIIVSLHFFRVSRHIDVLSQQHRLICLECPSIPFF